MIASYGHNIKANTTKKYLVFLFLCYIVTQLRVKNKCSNYVIFFLLPKQPYRPVGMSQDIIEHN